MSITKVIFGINSTRAKKILSHMKKKTFLHRLILIFFLANIINIYPTTVFADKRCPTIGNKVKINIKNTPARVIYKFNHSRGDLERMQRKRGRHITGGKFNVLGLTLTEFKYTLKTSVKILKIPGGYFCAYPISYDLKIGYEDFLVFIDRRYKPGTCEHKAVLEHENSHVRLYKHHLKKHLPYIKKYARNATLNVGTVVVSSPDLGSKHIQGKFQRRIIPLIKKMNREANLSNARIDTPQSYKKLQSLCKNW